MYLKRLLKLNSFFAVCASVSLTLACGTNTGLEVRVALNDFVAFANIFTNEQENFDFIYEFEKKEIPTEPEEEETEEVVEPKPMVFANNSNYLSYNCTDFICENKNFTGTIITSDKYNNLTAVPEVNSVQNLESSQFSIDNLAKRLDIVPFASEEKEIYDFSVVSLSSEPKDFIYYYDFFDELESLYFYSRQNLRIVNPINGTTLDEDFNLFDLRKELSTATINELLDINSTILTEEPEVPEVPEETEEPEEVELINYIYIESEKSDIPDLRSELNKLFYFANNDQNLSFVEKTEEIEPEEPTPPTQFVDASDETTDPETITTFTANFSKKFELNGKEITKIIIKQLEDSETGGENNGSDIEKGVV